MMEALVALCAIAIDRVTKLWCVRSLMHLPGQRMPVLPGVVEFRYVENTGAAFSVLSDHTWILIVVSAVAIVGLTGYLIKFGHTQSVLIRICLACIIGGAIGNLIDRLWYGYVIDFINPTFIRFAVFNVADIFVTCGAILLVFAVLLAKQPNKETKESIKNHGE